MTDGQQHSNAEQTAAVDEKRLLPRYLARAKATIIRETDRLRTGVPAKVYDLSIVGVGLRMIDRPPDLQEIVKVHIENMVQRVTRDVRGIVRHVTQMESGTWRVGIELLTRLSPLEVSLLKMSGLVDSGEFPVWI